MNNSSESGTQPGSSIPPDEPTRTLVIAGSDDPNVPHIGLVGDTYTILLTGKDTAGRFCLIDMHIPPGGGPPPHRHDFEESFILLEGEIEATFRGKKSGVKAGETVNIPANAPHQFHNSSTNPRDCYASARPPGRKSSSQRSASQSPAEPPPPKLDPAVQGKFCSEVESIGPEVSDRDAAACLRLIM